MALTKVSRGLLSTSIVDNGNATAITIDANENVGIGGSPAYKLDVASPVIQFGDSTDAFAQYKSSAGNWHVGANSSNAFAFYSGTYGSGTERMRIDSSGGVIFKGTLAAHQTNAGTAGYESNIFTLRAYGATSGTGQFRVLTGGGGGSAASEAMRIDSNGNLLVGTTNTANIATHTPNVVTDLQYGINDGSNLATFGLDRIHFNSANYFVLNASAIGVKLVNGATSWTTQSDENLKENIVELTSVLEKIKDFRCVTYNLKTQESDNIKTGFIAQDWQENFSSIIHADEDGTLGMNYTETIPVLLKAIQEQQATITALEARITQLENN